jgi:hypothetical protein
MARLRAMKLLCATLLVCAGAICISIGDLIRSGATGGALIGAILMVVGIPMLIRQWTDRGVLTHLADAGLWLLGPRRETRPEPPAPAPETAGRA